MVPAVDRSFQILDLLSRSPQPMGTSEGARRLRLAQSTVHRLLRSLEAGGALAEVHPPPPPPAGGAGRGGGVRDPPGLGAPGQGGRTPGAAVRVEKLRDLIARLHALPRRRLTLLVGVDGPAGAGKTTFTRALTALDPGLDVIQT